MLAPQLREPEVVPALARLAREPSLVEATVPMGGPDCLSERVPARAGVVSGPAASLGPASRSRDAATAWHVLPPFQVRIGDGR